MKAFRCNEGVIHACGSAFCDFTTLCGIFNVSDDLGEHVEVESALDIDCCGCLDVVLIAVEFGKQLRDAKTREKKNRKKGN